MPVVLIAASSASAEAATTTNSTSRPPGEWTSPGLSVPEDPSMPKFFKTENGIKIQELSPGTGSTAAKAGDLVLVDYVLRRANGYFICELPCRAGESRSDQAAVVPTARLAPRESMAAWHTMQRCSSGRTTVLH